MEKCDVSLGLITLLLCCFFLFGKTKLFVILGFSKKLSFELFLSLPQHLLLCLSLLIKQSFLFQPAFR